MGEYVSTGVFWLTLSLLNAGLLPPSPFHRISSDCSRLLPESPSFACTSPGAPTRTGGEAIHGSLTGSRSLY